MMAWLRRRLKAGWQRATMRSAAQLRNGATRPGEQGVALVVVVWLVVLLAMQVGLLAGNVRDSLRLSENEAALARGNAMAHAAVELAVARLNARDQQARWLPDGSTHGFALAGIEAELSIHADNGRININRAAPELIAGLMRSLGAKPEQATSLAKRVTQWRDSDPHRQSARVKARERIGSRMGVTEIGFLDTADLLRIKGMPRDLAAAMQPFVTIFTKDGRINPMLAAPEVLKSLPGISGETLAEVLRLRRQGGSAAAGIPALLAPASAHIDSAVGPAYRVRMRMAGGRVPGAPKPALGEGEIVIVSNLDAAAPYRVLAWRFGPGAIVSEPIVQPVGDGDGSGGK